jgi:signal peptidase
LATPSVEVTMRPRRVFRLAGLLLLAVVVLAFVVFAVPDIVGAEHSYVVTSGSMAPALTPGDAIIVDDTDPAAIREDDIITYRQPGEETTTTHRVVDVRQGDDTLAFQTKGDANEDPDPQPVAAQNVVGTVAFTIPALGFVVQFANTTLGFILLFCLPVGLFVASEVWRLVGTTGVLGASKENNTADADADDTNNDPDGDDAAECENSAGDTDAVDDTPDASRGDSGPSSDEATDTGDDSDSADTADPADDPATVSVHPGDLTVTVALLAVVAPYAVYVGFILQTAFALTVAFASVFLLLATGTLRVLAYRSAIRRRGEDSQPSPATDGGTPAEDG